MGISCTTCAGIPPIWFPPSARSACSLSVSSPGPPIRSHNLSHNPVRWLNPPRSIHAAHNLCDDPHAQTSHNLPVRWRNLSRSVDAVHRLCDDLCGCPEQYRTGYILRIYPAVCRVRAIPVSPPLPHPPATVAYCLRIVASLWYNVLGWIQAVVAESVRLQAVWLNTTTTAGYVNGIGGSEKGRIRRLV